MPLSYSKDNISDKKARERATEMLRIVGLSDRLYHEPSRLSGGQQQRVAIARALVNRPKLIFADEPTGNLDSQTSREILETFRELNKKEGITIILVTHDPAVVNHTERVIRIADGKIVSDSSVQKDAHLPGKSEAKPKAP